MIPKTSQNNKKQTQVCVQKTIPGEAILNPVIISFGYKMILSTRNGDDDQQTDVAQIKNNYISFKTVPLKPIYKRQR